MSLGHFSQSRERSRSDEYFNRGRVGFLPPVHPTEELKRYLTKDYIQLSRTELGSLLDDNQKLQEEYLNLKTRYDGLEGELKKLQYINYLYNSQNVNVNVPMERCYPPPQSYSTSGMEGYPVVSNEQVWTSFPTREMQGTFEPPLDGNVVNGELYNYIST